MATLPSVGKEYSVSFDLLVQSGVDSFYHNVLHLTTKGDIGKLGYRIPAVYLRWDNVLHICSAVNGKSDYIFNPINHTLTEGQWYNIQIQQVQRNDKVTQQYITT